MEWQHSKRRNFYGLNNGVTLNNIKGLLPDSTFKGDATHLQFTFNNLEPYPKNNILVWYNVNNNDKIDFNTISKNAGTYFSDLDNFPVADFNKPSFKFIYKNNFKVKDTVSIIIWSIVGGVAFLVIGLIVLLVYAVYKLIKRGRSRHHS